MQTFILLLRGINVSGHNIIKMAALKEELSNIGFQNVVTYIQSGNVVFESSLDDKFLIKDQIQGMIKSKFQLEITPHILSRVEFEEAFVKNPFIHQGLDDFKKLHVTFLDHTPSQEQIDKLLPYKAESEELIFGKICFYMHFPDGYAKTKLSNQAIESKLKSSATSRNWNTMMKLDAILKEQF